MYFIFIAKKRPLTAARRTKKAVLQISSDDEADQDPGNLTIGKVQLTPEDLEAVEEGKCLQDVHITAANTLLKEQFPDRAGFQCTLYLQNHKALPQSEGTIQIHFDAERSHWATSVFSSNKVHFFDSRYVGYISDGVEQQVKEIYGHLVRKQLTLQVVHVLQQQGVTACGVYAIAYAVHLANGLDPSKVKFNQKQMRPHFLTCLQKKKLDTFPIEKNIARVARPDLFVL